MIRRSTWIVFALFALAVGAAVWWDRSDRSFQSEPTATPLPESLWNASYGDVVALQVEAQGDQVHVRRDSEVGWRLERPPAEFAAVGRVERAVASALSPIPRGEIEGGEPAEYGLDPPQYELRLELGDGSVFTLEVGAQSPTGAVTYARVPREPTIYLLPSTTLQPVAELISEPPIATATPPSPATEADP